MKSTKIQKHRESLWAGDWDGGVPRKSVEAQSPFFMPCLILLFPLAVSEGSPFITNCDLVTKMPQFCE